MAPQFLENAAFCGKLSPLAGCGREALRPREGDFRQQQRGNRQMLRAIDFFADMLRSCRNTACTTVTNAVPICWNKAPYLSGFLVGVPEFLFRFRRQN